MFSVNNANICECRCTIINLYKFILNSFLLLSRLVPYAAEDALLLFFLLALVANFTISVTTRYLQKFRFLQKQLSLSEKTLPSEPGCRL
jgi:hypothetical protein